MLRLTESREEKGRTHMTTQTHDASTSAQPTQSLVTMVTNLAVGLSNEEFGLLARWMTVEANRRRERLAETLKRGDEIVFINYSDKLTKGVVAKLGSKNALIKTENGGKMYVPLARLEKASDSRVDGPVPTMASLPSSAPPAPDARQSGIETVAPRAKAKRSGGKKKAAKAA